MALTIKGQYFEILGYLYGLGELDRLVRVNSVAVSPALDDETGVNLLSVTINATAFTTGEIVVPATPEVDEPDIPEPAPEETTTTSSTTTTTTTVGG